MIKFFRHIRRNMISQKSISRYLLYAIGEILLVVIGILIALQVNNWNEENKMRLREHALLSEIRDNLATTRSAIVRSLELNRENMDRYQFLAETLENKEPYTTRMDTAFGHLPYWDTPYLTETAYQNVKNTDINIISNDSLRKQITELHEYDFMRLKNDWDRWEWDINQNIVMPFFARHIQGSMTDRYVARPNDYESLKNNKELANILSVLFRTRIWGFQIMNDCLEHIDQVISGIDAELK